MLTEEAVNIQVGAPARILRWGGDNPLQARVRSKEPSAFTTTSVSSSMPRLSRSLTSAAKAVSNVGARDFFNLLKLSLCVSQLPDGV